MSPAKPAGEWSRANALDMTKLSLELHGFKIYDTDRSDQYVAAIYMNMPFVATITSSVLDAREELYKECLDFLKARERLKGK